MHNLTTQCHQLCQEVLKQGDVAIDATAGNGHDTLFLAKQVGDAGKVYAFDIQTSALHATTRRIAQEEINNVVLINENHAHMQKFVDAEHHQEISVVMFNLGYLPGGDKALITRSASTIIAIKHSLSMLRRKGILTVIAYSGHAGGAEETNAVKTLFENLNDHQDDQQFVVTQFEAQQQSISPPQLFVIQKL